MSQEIHTADGRYLVADQGDGNLVVYDHGIAVFDRWSYEARDVRVGLPDGAHPPVPDSGAVQPDPNLSAFTLKLIPVTPERDGPFVNRGYSYWAQAYRRNEMVYCFAGHADGHPRFYGVRVPEGTVQPLGACLNRFGYLGTGEGCYWDSGGNIYLVKGAQLHCVSIFTGADSIVMDVSSEYPGCDLWQAHSSDDGTVHSATLREVVPDGPYPSRGTVVQQPHQLQFFPADNYQLDESQITSDGKFLLIKSAPDDDNLVVDMTSGVPHWLPMNEGALGHSDCGASLAIGADRANGQIALIDFTRPLTAGLPLYRTWNAGHIAVRGPLCIQTDAEAIYQVRLDGSGLNRLVNHGQTGDPTNYDNQVKANISPDGSVVCYMANNRLYLLVLR